MNPALPAVLAFSGKNIDRNLKNQIIPLIEQ